ncbi:hypothetical protein C6P45_000006 [Maudiozyma exigua]|uniref:Uncharacterized protein n=1 Tax=Maudiozyma exigua TaxID=34358 RepID=A0A9P6WEZ2_MAUEX|nr:hypothetical protein C6P45_000006 [Kazachstania exigua]
MPTMLMMKMISTALGLIHSGASVAVVNSDELLHDLDQSSKTPPISSSQSIPINCTGKGILKLKFYDKSIINIPAYVTPEVEHNL